MRSRLRVHRRFCPSWHLQQQNRQPQSYSIQAAGTSLGVELIKCIRLASSTRAKAMESSMSASESRSSHRPLILHPLALAAYPVLSLAAANIQQIPLSQALRPLAVSLLGSILLVGILRLLTGDWMKAGILGSLSLILFFSYGLIYDTVKNAAVGGLLLGRHRFLSLVWLALLGSLGWLTWRARASRLAPVNSFLNVACLVAVALPLFSMARLGVLSGKPAFTSPGSVEGPALHWDGPGQPPDIYYIILDSYAREDIMRELYGFRQS